MLPQTPYFAVSWSSLNAVKSGENHQVGGQQFDFHRARDARAACNLHRLRQGVMTRFSPYRLMLLVNRLKGPPASFSMGKATLRLPSPPRKSFWNISPQLNGVTRAARSQRFGTRTLKDGS